ncbi:hypothetical protein K5X85_29150 [Streptomyces sp. A144]|uniref:hypothetical protein n=1 Tax=Streptomyces sp. A144 TaxID=2871487 RepID=UPI001CBB210A|nr:hypothetical protein [Streptomyces sp. A144]UAX56797.1 hypothetical protein K5X85_29150 [Streptomyces sp. A144]
MTALPDEAHRHAQWTVEQHRRAQRLALGWAERAEIEHDQADEAEDTAQRWAGNPHLSAQRAREQADAQRRRARSAEATRLAEMWARVAQALAGQQQPSAVVVTDSTLSTEDAERLKRRAADVMAALSHRAAVRGTSTE